MEEEEEEASSSSSSSSSADLISRVDISEITNPNAHQSLSTSAVLFACKQKILRPFLRLLAVTGLRGYPGPSSGASATASGHVHLCLVLLFTVLGYAVRYSSCYRRDLGPVCVDGSDDAENDVFGVAVPIAVHFAAYCYTLYLFRLKETEQLENLVEKTFLLSAHRTTRLVKRLWIVVSVGVLWVLTSLCAVVGRLALATGKTFPWLSSDGYRLPFEVLLVLAFAWQDIIEATVITCYCLQVHLLTSSLYFLKEKLLLRTIRPLAWIREVNECQNVLCYINVGFSPGVAMFVFLNWSWTLSTCLRLFTASTEGPVFVAVALALWLVASLAPVVSAACLTSACGNLRRLGHEVRVRPFVYQDTPGEDLDTVLLYTSTLRMKATLFGVTVSGRYLCAGLTITAVVLMVAGQSSWL